MRNDKLNMMDIVLEKKIIQNNISNVYFSKNPFIKFIFRMRIIEALKLAGDVSNKKIIDIGCGAGILSYNLAINNAKVNGFDINKVYLKKLSSIYYDYAYFDLINGNVVEMPFKSGSFDIIFALDMLEHIEHLDDALMEIKRILRIDGLLIVSIPNENKLYKLCRKIAGFESPGHCHNANELIKSFEFNFKQIRNIGIPTALIPYLDLFKIVLYVIKND